MTETNDVIFSWNGLQTNKKLFEVKEFKTVLKGAIIVDSLPKFIFPEFDGIFSKHAQKNEFSDNWKILIVWKQ